MTAKRQKLAVHAAGWQRGAVLGACVGIAHWLLIKGQGCNHDLPVCCQGHPAGLQFMHTDAMLEQYTWQGSQLPDLQTQVPGEQPAGSS